MLTVLHVLSGPSPDNFTCIETSQSTHKIEVNFSIAKCWLIGHQHFLFSFDFNYNFPLFQKKDKDKKKPDSGKKDKGKGLL